MDECKHTNMELDPTVPSGVRCMDCGKEYTWINGSYERYEAIVETIQRIEDSWE